MKPSDLYAMPTVEEDDWTRSPSVAVMFGEEQAYLADARPSDLPLGLLTKAHVEGPDPDGESDTFWQVVTWEGSPLGTVVRSGDVGWRVVTDARLRERALMGLVGMATRRARAEEVGADVEVQGLDDAGGHVLARVGDGFRPVERRLCGGRTPLVDAGRLADALLGGGATVAEVMRSLGSTGLRDAVVSAMHDGLRVATDHAAVGTQGLPVPCDLRWDGILAATDERTYLVCIGPYDARLPVTEALRVIGLGPASLVDDLSTGPVVETGLHAPGP